MARPTGYIGITGFRTVEEVRQINDHVSRLPVGYFMFGITSSNKRLADPTSQGGTSPRLLDINSLVKEIDTHNLPMIHYYSSNSQEQLADEVVALFDYCRLDNYCVGLQINALWPLPHQIENMRKAFEPQFKITMQLPQAALVANNDQIIKRLREYDGLIQYVLIDPSGGLGVDFNAVKAGELMLEINNQFDSITPGVAGGFSDDNVKKRIAQIKGVTLCNHCHQGRLLDYSIDAQGKLRDKQTVPVAYPANSPPIETSILNTGRTIRYMDAALSAFYSE